MKLANAPNILAAQTVRKEVAELLADGETVHVKGNNDHPAEVAAAVPAKFQYPVLSPDLYKTMTLGGSSVGRVNITPAVSAEFNKRGIAIGAGTGAMIGAGVGILLQQLRNVHPTSALAVDAACVLIGTGAGVAVGSGLFEIEPTYDGKTWGAKVRAVVPKAG